MHHAERCLLDLIGVAAAGTATRMSKIARDYAEAHLRGRDHSARIMYLHITGGLLFVARIAHGVTATASSVSFASDRKGYGPGMPGTFALPEPNA